MGGVVKKWGIKHKAGMGPLCLLCHLPHTITRIQDTLQVFRELVLFYNRWKDDETELWNPWPGSRCLFFKYLICNILLEFQEKALNLLLEINKKLNDLGRIYEPEGSMISINI